MKSHQVQHAEVEKATLHVWQEADGWMIRVDLKGRVLRRDAISEEAAKAEALRLAGASGADWGLSKGIFPD